MMDLISRQAVIDVINAIFPVDPMKSEYAQGIACGAALAKTYIEQLPSVQQWISTDDKLPPPNEEQYLVRVRSGGQIYGGWEYNYDFAWWGEYWDRTGHGWDWTCIGTDWDGDVKITHWMPLPEPPKDGE